MSRIIYTLVSLFSAAYLLLLAGSLTPASAQRPPRYEVPPRYEQAWHTHWRRSQPRWRERRKAWRREVRRAWRQSPYEDRGRRWHGYRSE